MNSKTHCKWRHLARAPPVKEIHTGRTVERKRTRAAALPYPLQQSKQLETSRRKDYGNIPGL